MSRLFIFPHYYVMKMMKIALILQNITNFPFNESVCMKLKMSSTLANLSFSELWAFKKIAKFSIRTKYTVSKI